MTPETAARSAIERGERLVEEQQPRTRRQRAGERDPLSFPARQRPRIAIFEIRHPQHHLNFFNGV